jgi:hypothetical protein
MIATLRRAARTLRVFTARRPVVAALAVVTLAAAPAGAASGWWGFTTRVSAHDYNVHRLDVSGWRVTVRGDGDTDLDCYLGKNGRLIAADDDATDYCVLDTRGVAGPYTLYVRNLGGVYNQYDVRVE